MIMKKQYVDCKDVRTFLESISYKVVDAVSTETSDIYYTDCQKLMMIQDRFFKFMAKHGKDYTNVLMFYSESTNNVVIRLSKKVDENRLQQAIIEYNQKRNEIDSLLTIEVIKHVQVLGKKFPQIQSFAMAMGLISFELKYDMRYLDNGGQICGLVYHKVANNYVNSVYHKPNTKFVVWNDDKDIVW